ncbi:MAG: hypothetical protein LBI62_04210 [Candidatus Accumulibacter sp.]|nr:hypothetical protein [Accumulibacter sp.]
MKRLPLFATTFATAFSLAIALPASAAPAPWYKWQSITGDTVCAQTSPGPGWIRLETSYVDPRCLRRSRSTTNDKKNRG